MSDVIDNQAVETEDPMVQEAVTMEQFEELKNSYAELAKQNEAILLQNGAVKKAQSGSDKTVTDLRKQLKEQEDAGKTEVQLLAERLEAQEKKTAISEQKEIFANQKALALQILGIKGEGVGVPKRLDQWLGKDDEETEANIMEYIEEELAKQLKFKDEFAKNNGRTVQRNKGKGDFKTLEDYSDAEIEAMSTTEFEKIQSRSKK
jgi:hypothetical protein